MGTPFKSLIPLSEIISSAIGGQPFSKKVWAVYNRLVERFGSEFAVMLDASRDEITMISDEKVADYIIKTREGQVEVQPGYDGVYGQPLFSGRHKIPERAAGIEPGPSEKQKSIVDFSGH